MIITARMPAVSQVRTAARASGRGGSIIATRPSRVMPDSGSSTVAPAFLARASTRRPSAAMRCSTARARSRSAGVSSTSRPERSWLVQPASTSSAAPFE